MSRSSQRLREAKSLTRFHAFRFFATSYLYVPIFMLFQADRGLTTFQRFALGGIYCAVLVAVEVPPACSPIASAGAVR